MTQPAFASAQVETEGQLQDRLAREAHGIALAEAARRWLMQHGSGQAEPKHCYYEKKFRR